MVVLQSTEGHGREGGGVVNERMPAACSSVPPGCCFQH